MDDVKITDRCNTCFHMIIDSVDGKTCYQEECNYQEC